MSSDFWIDNTNSKYGINNNMDNSKQTAFQFSMGSFTWFTGVVEDRLDPKKLGRLKVRCMGFHTDDKSDIPSEDLFWMNVMMPTNSSSMNGIGQSPTGILEGTWVVGFFRDGVYLQDGIIMGTLGGIPNERNPEKGFFDPNDVYPKDDFMDEPDTNRLSRNEKIEETIVQQKKDDRQTGIETALGGSPWEEPEVPDNREYPYNHVKETESGHIEEFDDTEDHERYHRYHKEGTFLEIHSDGDEVRHVKKDKYEIIFGDNNIHIKGDVNITIDGDANVLVKGDSNIETKGDWNQYIHGDYRLLIDGEWHVQTNNHAFLNSPMGGRSFDINSSGSEQLEF